AGNKKPAPGAGYAEVDDEAVSKDRHHPPLREIDELIGDDQIEWPDVVLHAANGGDRDDPLHAERFQAPDVRAEVQLGRRQAMPATVPRQEDDRAAVEGAGAELVRRIAEWRADAAPANVGQAFELVETAATDDADRALFHRCSAGREPTISPPIPSSASFSCRRTTRRISASGPSKMTST